MRLGYAATDTVTVGYATADPAGDWQGASPATAGADYTGVSGSLTFAAGETVKTVPVSILDDAVDEGRGALPAQAVEPAGRLREGGARRGARDHHQ